MVGAISRLGRITKLFLMHYGSIIQTGTKGFGRNALVLVGFSILYAIALGVLSIASTSVGTTLVRSLRKNHGRKQVFPRQKLISC